MVNIIESTHGDIKVISFLNEEGEIHREDGFARYSYLNGKLFCAGWYKKGVLHRDHNPAWYKFHENGSINVVMWIKNGIIKNASVWDDTGKLKYKY